MLRKENDKFSSSEVRDHFKDLNEIISELRVFCYYQNKQGRRGIQHIPSDAIAETKIIKNERKEKRQMGKKGDNFTWPKLI